IGLMIGMITFQFSNFSFGIGNAAGLLFAGIMLGFLRANHPTFPNQVKKLITSIREHTKNGLASKITSVKNTHTSLNEKFKTGK
ncbi:hypothetical protein ONQ97_27135, partial [Salmonella enterica subsp. enterica serovar Virginia]|nr:hypothetical protein [Salmonella enterica subsp. enterica serovar Virginia]